MMEIVKGWERVVNLWSQIQRAADLL
jgi:hypothetical protein